MEYMLLKDAMPLFHNQYTSEELIEILVRNPQFCKINNEQYYVNKRFINIFKNSSKDQIFSLYIDGISRIDMRSYTLKGDILDLGAGGEGIIAKLFQNHVIGIAPKEHGLGLKHSPPCRLKLFMDARNLTFIEKTFDHVTSFFTLEYIPYHDYQLVFKEAYKVLKENGFFHVWDCILPKNTYNKEMYLRYYDILLPDETISIGYSSIWNNRKHTKNQFTSFAKQAGFTIEQIKIKDRVIYMKCKKESLL